MAGREERRARDAVIGQLRVRGGCEPLSARLRLEGLLGALDFSPGGPPPSAILCIHKLEDPRPRTLRLHRYELRPPAEWEQAFRESLRERLAHAARPVRGELSGEARAVVFADPAELYACLASDVGSGQAASRWWWTSLFRGSDPYRTLVAEWGRAPEYVPASLELLARWGRAEAFLRSLGEAEARELLAKVNRRFGLRALEDALAWGGTVPPVESPGESRSGAGVREAPGAGAGDPPWRRWAPEVASAVLGIEPATLLGVALMVRRAPRVVDLPGTAAAVAGWRERMHQRGVARPSAASPGSRPAPPSPRMPRDSAGQEKPRDPAAPARRRKTGPSSEEPTASASPDTVRSRQRTRVQWEWSPVEHAPGPASGRSQAPPGGSASRATEENHGEREHGALGASSPATGIAPVSPTSARELPAAGEPPRNPSPPATTGVHPGHPTTVPVTAEPSSTRTSPPVPTGPDSAPGTPGPRPPLHPFPREDAEPFSWTGAPIPTRLGGVFYLLNLGLALELYGDFTQPDLPGLRLPVWDFLSLLGRELLVEPSPEDPLWTLLARLAGRAPGTPPGDGFEPPTEWRTPPAWLKSFREPGTWTWTAPPPGTPGRLLVKHPAGFLVLDVPRTPEEPGAQLQRETESLAGLATFTRASDTPAGEVAPDAPLERWLGWLVPYVRARLARALGTDGPAELSRVLLEHEARVHVTESHVDVVFSLEALPLPIRFAGLDRDIGWIPAAGRHVLFHFE